MGPPLSPREPRRSGRRSVPSTSTSKSPDSDTAKEAAQRPPLTSANSSRSKKPKQEDIDESIEKPPQPNGRAKRKPKDKDKQPEVTEGTEEQPEQEEEVSVTRCVCGSTGTGEDEDQGEFMVQCETCNVWQHGVCMGYESEHQAQADDYYCERCRPEMHQELLKKLSKKARHSSITSRLSRSHSPHLAKQPSKRRNTMNSRDAAFDENLKEILETTAAEAGAVPEAPPANGNPDPEEEIDVAAGGRKKRRRSDDDAGSKKRTRSMSTTSDHRPDSVQPAEDSPNPTPKPPAPANKRNKRGGRKSAVHDTTPGADGTPGAPPKQRNTSRNKGSHAAKRNSHAARGSKANEDDGSRRSQANGVNGQGPSSSNAAYRNSHAYAISQQTLYHSWNLPDYLAHLADQLPTDIPRPLEVRSGRGESVEERGVKVKWPSKRMSVGDMNKRVRALVEWVGREQANAHERGRRREALQAELARMDGGEPNGQQPPMDVDQDGAKAIRDMEETENSITMAELEKLMQELIGFQERFGPGVKTRERDRRTLVAA